MAPYLFFALMLKGYVFWASLEGLSFPVKVVSIDDQVGVFPENLPWGAYTFYLLFRSLPVEFKRVKPCEFHSLTLLPTNTRGSGKMEFFRVFALDYFTQVSVMLGSAPRFCLGKSLPD